MGEVYVAEMEKSTWKYSGCASAALETFKDTMYPQRPLKNIAYAPTDATHLCQQL